MIEVGRLNLFAKQTVYALIGGGMGCLIASTAFAGGDVGGSCCADLEERVAELEETAVRKGNRKASLYVSGHVNKAVMYVNDGDDSDVFVVDNSNSSSRFRFLGYSYFRKGWIAGYFVEFEFDTAEDWNVRLVDANDNDLDDGSSVAGALDLRHAYWMLHSDDYGTFRVGQQDPATYLITWMDMSGTYIVGNASKASAGASVLFRTTAGTQSAVSKLGSVDAYYEGLGDYVRYDSPTRKGLKVTAAWGEDDVHDVALRYGKKHEDYHVVAGIGYSSNKDEGNDYTQVSGSFGVIHSPSGLNIHFAAGDRDTDGSTLDQRFYYGKIGLKRKWRSAGETAISFDYYRHKEHAVATAEFTQWGVQLVQNIDAAAMQLYATYFNMDYDTDAADYKNIDVFMAGAKVEF